MISNYDSSRNWIINIYRNIVRLKRRQHIPKCSFGDRLKKPIPTNTSGCFCQLALDFSWPTTRCNCFPCKTRSTLSHCHIYSRRRKNNQINCEYNINTSKCIIITYFRLCSIPVAQLGCVFPRMLYAEKLVTMEAFEFPSCNYTKTIYN